ncbi:hypothetical protein EAO75_01530 [Streptomyces sp. uw30]|uniref:hypothetical protein n=1 Tax=Streptomyces sp. uw30 TaxID=1828179 RepID=UPI0011CD73FF|nr:hypothetical protein [Streptomyces sp. uw30]TXS54254.1 hypothetical protein EAO75_01530 [Streptomyces sp. uw30]
MPTLSPAPVNSGAARPTPRPAPLTWPQVAKTLGVLVFTGWMLTHGYNWYLTLAITFGAVTIASGLSSVPHAIARVARALHTDPQ